jgi:hypothetical protein
MKTGVNAAQTNTFLIAQKPILKWATSFHKVAVEPLPEHGLCKNAHNKPGKETPGF